MIGMRTLVGTAALLAIVLGSPGRPAEGEDAVDPAALAEAFRPLLARHGKISTSEIPRQVMIEQSQQAPRNKRKAFLDGWLRGHVLSADREDSEPYLEGLIHVFSSPDEAREFVEIQHLIKKRERSTPEARITTHAFTDAAGPKGLLPGFHIHRQVDFGGPKLALSQHFVHRGSLVALLTVMDAPKVSLAAQHRILDHVDAALRDPARAATLPAPDFDAPHGPLLLVVQDRRERPVRGALVSVVPESTNATEPVTAETDAYGVVRLPGVDRAATHLLTVMPGDTTDDLARLRAADWKPVRRALTLERGWTLRGTLVDAQEAPVAGAVVFRKALAGWPLERADPGGRFEIRGLPRTTLQVLGVTDPATLPKDPADLEGPWTRLRPTKERVTLPVQAPVLRKGN